MNDETPVIPEEGNGEDVNVNVPDSTGGQQLPDTLPQPQPLPDPGHKDQPGEPDPNRPGPVLGPAGFSLR